MNKPLLQIKQLSKEFSNFKVLKDLSFTIQNGETLGVVGESGCGKTTLGKLILRLYWPSSGEIIFEENNIFSLSSKEMKNYRQKVQMIFQDPFASLNPRMTTEEIIREPLDIHKNISKKARKERVQELLSHVGLPPESSNRFPHEFSGGQRQRIGIARALSLQPKFIVCDEPLAALDVSIGAQIINLLKKLQEAFKLTYLFISHDLAMIRYISNRVIVMYLGRIMELAGTEELFKNPLHPYTIALLSAIPIPDPKREKSKSKIVLKGEIPSHFNPTKGCVFCNRCPQAMQICKEVEPEYKEVSPGHFVNCHLFS